MGCSGSKSDGVEYIRDDLTVGDFLRSNAFFKNLNDPALANKAAKVFEVVRIKNVAESVNKRVPIIKRGDNGDCLYIVAKGKVEVSALDEKSNRRVLRKLVKQDVFTEMGFIHNVPSTVDIDAVSDVVLLKLSKDAYTMHAKQKYFSRLTNWLDDTAETMVVSSLKNVPMMSAVPEEKLGVIAKMFELKVVATGEKVFSQGDDGDAFYILTKGKLVVTTLDENQQPIELSRLRPGATFGEMSLVDPQKRSATITALTDATLFMLSRADFRRFLEMMPSLEADLLKSVKERSAVNMVAKKIPFFQSLGPNKLHLLATVATINSHPPGEVIMMEGKNFPNTFFIITQGQCEITKSDQHLRFIEEGAYFGEISLVSGRDATATVRASGKKPCVCLEITRSDFDALFHAEPAAFAEIQLKVLGSSAELKHFLNHPMGRKYYKEHAAAEYATENIDFWLAVEDLERMGRHRMRKSVLSAMGVDVDKAESDKRNKLTARVHEIYDQYVDEGSKEQINIKSNVLAGIKNAMESKKYSYEIFTKAKDEIYELMSMDVFERFKKTDRFQDMLKDIGVMYVDAEDAKLVKKELDTRSKSVMEETLDAESVKAKVSTVLEDPDIGGAGAAEAEEAAAEAEEAAAEAEEEAAEEIEVEMTEDE